MIIVAKKAELNLFRELRRCRAEMPAQRCFYIRFSKAGIPKRELFETFLQLLQKIPDSYTAQVYICEDKDVFILMRGFMQRQFIDFLKDLSHKLEADHLLELAKVYEVGQDWDDLEKMCREKIEDLDAEKDRIHEQERKEQAENATLKVLAGLDDDQLRSVGVRREARLSPLVLVVEDDQITRTLAGNVLSSTFELAYAKSGEEAIREFVNSAPDAVFLDIGLPDIGGHEVLECIFQIDPEAHVIMFSGRKDKDNIMHALELGAKGFVGKPFTREKMFEYIRKSPYVQDKEKRKGELPHGGAQNKGHHTGHHTGQAG